MLSLTGQSFSGLSETFNGFDFIPHITHFLIIKKGQTPRTELEQAQIEIEQLKHKLYLAEMERDLLKKLDEVERRDDSQK